MKTHGDYKEGTSEVQHAELQQLIEGLTQPAAYQFEVDVVEVRQTHISVVFLAGASVFKVKKPVKLPFLDFSTLEKRKFYCDEEVRLNRRLAADVYRGVVPIRVKKSPSTHLKIGGCDGQIVDWAVEMTRLPDEATFASRMEHGTLTEVQIEKLSRRIATFHQDAKGVSDQAKAVRIVEAGQFDRVANAVRDNISFAKQQVGQTISKAVFERLHEATEAALMRLQPLLERRVAARMIRDLHGDLHLDHVYLFEDRATPSDLVVVDCIEFNEAFRFIDVVADIAFCAMDFLFHGRRQLGRTFCEAYFAASGDVDGQELLAFYTAYRAAVRGKVDGILASEKEVASEQRQAAANRSKAYWLLALGQLEPVERRPVMVLVSGLPGTGKSTLARGLADSLKFQWIRSDQVRKELTGYAGASATADYRSGIYAPEWTDRTYSECLRQAIGIMHEGGRVIIDASFGEDHRRREFLQAAVDEGVPAMWLVCQASPQTVQERLANRRNDASDADWNIYQKAATAWQPPGVESQRVLVTIDAEQEPQSMFEQARDAISGVLSNLQ